MNQNIIIGLVVVAVLLLGGWFFITQQPKTTTPTASPPPSATTPPPATSSSSTSTAPSTATVTYNGTSFSPSSVTLKSGGQLTIMNSGSSAIQFNSNPHPSHTDNSELNIGNIDAGQSKTVTLTKIGTWGYHNHLNPGQTGSIIVQ